jgi:hypothetical protein
VCDPIGMENVGWGTVGGKGFIGPYCTPGGFLPVQNPLRNCRARSRAFRSLLLARNDC